MARALEFVFLATGKVERYYTGDDDRYVLADGTFEPVVTDIVWCNRCGKVTGGEWIETPEELDAAVDAVNDPETEVGRLLQFDCDDSMREGLIRDYQQILAQRRRWLAERVSPAKCLTCGGTDLISLRAPEGVETPAGKIVPKSNSRRATMAYNPRYFSPEGDRIEYTLPPEETKPQEHRTWWQFWNPPAVRGSSIRR